MGKTEQLDDNPETYITMAIEYNRLLTEEGDNMTVPGYPPLLDWHEDDCQCASCEEDNAELASCRHCILL